MKLIFLLGFLTFSISCTQDISKNPKSSPTPVVESSLSETNKALKKEFLEKEKHELEKFIADQSKFCRLSALADKNLLNEDLEIRVWRFSAFGDKDLIFVLKRANKNWSANLLQKTVNEKDIGKRNPPSRFSNKQLENPKSGWEELWQKLTDAKILTLPNIVNEPSLDGWAFVIETNVEGNYRVFELFSPEYSKISEAQQMIKIITIISEEFNLNDFDENNFMQP